MDMIKGLTDAMAYIEANLCGKIDLAQLARIACVSGDSFARFFSYMTGMTLAEYIRRRRLTRAAYALRRPGVKVIDVALAYGYESADAFARAFARQHGVSPARSRDPRQPIRAYPPASFHIMIKGAKEMELRIIETEAIRLRGLCKRFEGEAADRFSQEHAMWGLEYDDYMRRIHPEIPGTWYGIWDAGTYWIAKTEGEAHEGAARPYEIPAGKYAVFTTGLGGFAGDELPKLRELIFDAWLPDSGYRQAQDFEVEVYRLFPKGERHRRQYEIWVPVTG